MTREEILTGWLVFSRLGFGHDDRVVIPTAVRVALVERGWVTLVKSEDVDDKGDHLWDVHVTAEGCCVGDLAGPEWGVEPDFVEA